MLVKDIQLYVFCHKYSESNMRRNKSGAFELYFVGEQGNVPHILLLPLQKNWSKTEGACLHESDVIAADKFIEVFFPPRVEPYEIEEAVAGPSHP